MLTLVQAKNNLVQVLLISKRFYSLFYAFNLKVIQDLLQNTAEFVLFFNPN